MQTFFQFFAQLSAWHWFGFAIILVIFEVLLGTNFFLLWLGVSAATVGAFAFIFPQIFWEYQFLLFAAISIACVLLWTWHLRHMHNESDNPNLNRRSEQYVGRMVTLKEPIVNGRGRVHIDDSYWRIEGPDLPTGTLVKIIDVDGVVLKVQQHHSS